MNSWCASRYRDGLADGRVANDVETAALPKMRVKSIDAARAMAVIGVVFNHVVDGLIGASLLPEHSKLALFNSALYIFRMPALAFLLGIFIPRGVEGRGFGRYLQERVSLFGYLYLIWFVIESGMEVATSRWKNTPQGIESMLTFWIPPGHLWFIPFLMVSSIVVATTKVWRQGVVSWLCLTGLCVSSIATWAWNPGIIGLQGLSLLFFVAAGSAVNLASLGNLMRGSRSCWALVGMGTTTVFVLLWRVGVVPATQLRDATLGTRSISIVAASAGVVSVLSAAIFLAAIPKVGDLLAAIGRRTLPIYLAHVIVVAGFRIGLDAFGARSITLYILVLVPAGVLFPLAAYRLANGWRLGWLFTLPPSFHRPYSYGSSLMRLDDDRGR